MDFKWLEKDIKNLFDKITTTREMEEAIKIMLDNPEVLKALMDQVNKSRRGGK